MSWVEQEGQEGGEKLCSRKRAARESVKAAFIYFDSFHTPLISTASGCRCEMIRLLPDSPCVIGRSHRSCDYVLEDRRLSRQHCQILFDGFHRKIFILDGGRFRTKRLVHSNLHKHEETAVRASLNGIFLNGFKIGKDALKELSAGDEVSFACRNERLAGFLIQRIVYTEEALVRRGEAVFSAPLYPSRMAKGDDLITRSANFYLGHCRCILKSDDPISYIRGSLTSYDEIQGLCSCSSRPNNFLSFPLSTDPKLSPVPGGTPSSSRSFQIVESSKCIRANMQQLNSLFLYSPTEIVSELNHSPASVPVPPAYVIASAKPNTMPSNSMDKENDPQSHVAPHNETCGTSFCPPGKKFYLNRLEFMNYSSFGNHTVISLPELLFPVENLSRIFVATFTSDVLWFLSYCKVPGHLPVTIACHHTERCWSSSTDKRAYVPYSDYPNLFIVHPPFPEAIAFGRDRKKLGVACHHPKLLVLQREDSIRIVITSANLVARQWNSVTNTIWWQDFPRISAPDYSSIFTQLGDGEIDLDSRSDFTAQLVGFMASLVVDVPSQAHWIMEVAKYDFRGATGHLVTSVPGIHFRRTPYVSKSMQFLPATQNASCSFGMKFLGSVEASIVGLSHLFHPAADSNGAQLKKLATFLGKCHKNKYGMSEIVLRRNSNIPADANAVSILVSEPDEHSGDCIQLGFLPRDVAKWVSPLWDMGFFRFSGYICPREALAAALEGKTNKVPLILYVSKGASFLDISEKMQPELLSAMCSLVASLERCVGLWRLEEILGGYKWPESQEIDFIYGSSSIGSSINAQFLAAFSAAAGKRSLHFFESDESDPEWGCWSASQESKSPSIKLVFPTIERVKNSSCGILPSRHMLCFSEKTWQRLKTLNTFHDAIPQPSDRVRHPMHVKVARRRFQSKMDSSSFGWVYCGSHNFSAAAWGRPISNPFDTRILGTHKANCCLDQRLHICNYELGIIFIFPPSASKDNINQSSTNLDDVVFPFVIPVPKYGPRDRPATTQAMTKALAELTEQGQEKLVAATLTQEMIEEDISDEEEAEPPTEYVAEEKEEEKAYAEMLWSQVDSSQSC